MPNFANLSDATLIRYVETFQLNGGTTKATRVRAVQAHFESYSVDEGEVLFDFVELMKKSH